MLWGLVGGSAGGLRGRGVRRERRGGGRGGSGRETLSSDQKLFEKVFSLSFYEELFFSDLL
jgi:hypothetical protein